MLIVKITNYNLYFEQVSLADLEETQLLENLCKK